MRNWTFTIAVQRLELRINNYELKMKNLARDRRLYFLSFVMVDQLKCSQGTWFSKNVDLVEKSQNDKYSRTQ